MAPVAEGGVTSRANDGGRDRTPGSGLCRAALVVLLTLLGAASTACGSASGQAQTARNNTDTYGGLPSWLPKATVPVDRIVAASAKNPKLAIEGDTIRAVLPRGQTLVTVSGPTVPPFVTPPPPVTSATFTISLSHTTGRIPLRPVDFELVDGNGRFYSPQSFDGPSPPGLAPDRTTVSFQITEVMATGSGSIRWAPDGVPIATWDFTVEND